MQDSGTSIYGRVLEILTPSETDASLAVTVLDVFGLKATRHPIFGMPVLARSGGQASYAIVPIQVGHFTERPSPAKTNAQTGYSILVQRAT